MAAGLTRLRIARSPSKAKAKSEHTITHTRTQTHMCVLPAKSVSQSFAPSHSSDGRPAVARTVDDKIMSRGNEERGEFST